MISQEPPLQSNQCSCPVAGFCNRRQAHVSHVHWKKCQAGRVELLDRIYEEAKKAPPPKVYENRRRKRPKQIKGIGDLLHDVIFAKTGIYPCADCQSEILRLNAMTTVQVLQDEEAIARRIIARAQKRESKWWELHIKAATAVANLAPDYSVETMRSWVREACEKKQVLVMGEAAFGTVGKPRESFQPVPMRDYSNAVRHLNFHMWPLRESETWLWHLDQLALRKDLFNGFRVLSLAIDSDTVSYQQFKDAADSRGLVFDRIFTHRNDPRRGETVAWSEKIEWLMTQGFDHSDVIFYAHSKGVRNRVVNGAQVRTDNYAVRQWTDMMYSSCLDYWDLVKINLDAKLFTGSFKRFGAYRYPGNFRWHYSGTFYWFRLFDMLSRRPALVEQRYTGTEAFPGFKARPQEAGSLFIDNLQHNLYDEKSIRQHILPQWKEWQERHEQHRNRGADHSS